jgi:alkylation response protein AidB-like acyl-CoA dehydrogenase
MPLAARTEASAANGAAPRTETSVGAVSVAAAIGRDLATGAVRRDHDRVLPVAEMASVKRAGLHALRVPAQFGGVEADWLTVARVFLALSRGDPNVAQAIQSGTLFAEMLRADAPLPLRRRYFHAIVAGELVTNAIAERGGTFYGDSQTTIRRSDSARRIDGVKYYATGSAFAESFFVTANDEEGRVVTAIIPRDRPGVTFVDDWDGFGQRTTSSGTIRFEAVEVGDDETFVAVPPKDRRWHLQAGAQIMHAAIDAGIARAALDDGLTLCRERGRPLRESGVERQVDDPYVLSAIGAMSVRVEGAAALVERAARLIDVASDLFFSGRQDAEADVAASIAVGQARIATAEASLGVSEQLFELANASGVDRALGLDRHWRNARAHTTHDPLSYKFKFIGDHLLNGRTPPATAKF